MYHKIDDKFNKPVVFYGGKNAIYKLIEAILEEYEHYKQILKKYFNKNLIMSVEDEGKFRSSNKCWIRNKLFIEKDKKLRDHGHIPGNFCLLNRNIDPKLTKNVPAVFHNFRSFDGCSIMPEIGELDAEISIIPNGLEKYIDLKINKNLLFNDNMQFMNSSLDRLFKSLTGNGFNYFCQEFDGDLLKLVK